MVQSFDEESKLIYILSQVLTTCMALQVTCLYFSSLIAKVGAIIVPTNRVVRINKL